MYCGLTIAWNYTKKYVDISIIGYTKKSLQQFKHTGVQNFEDEPASYNKPYFGTKQQRADNVSTYEILAPSDINNVQSLVGTLWYYNIAVENTILVALGDLVLAHKKLQI